MRTLSFTSAADNDLGDIAFFIADASGSREAGTDFTRQLTDKCEHIARLGGILGSARPELRADIRSVPCKGYVIFFRYLGQHMEIVNVLHGSRDLTAYFD